MFRLFNRRNDGLRLRTVTVNVNFVGLPRVFVVFGRVPFFVVVFGFPLLGNGEGEGKAEVKFNVRDTGSGVVTTGDDVFLRVFSGV